MPTSLASRWRTSSASPRRSAGVACTQTRVGHSGRSEQFPAPTCGRRDRPIALGVGLSGWIIFTNRFLDGYPERLVAADGDPVSVALVRPVIEDRLMLGAAVVPERNRVPFPLEPAGQFWRLNMLEQECEQRVALGLAQLHDARGEAAIDEQELPAGDGMDAYHRMLEARKLHVAAFACLAVGMRLPGIVDGGQPVQHLAQRLRQGLVGQVHVGKHGVATAIRRNLVDIEDRAHRRLLVAGDVGMPGFAGDALAVLVGLDYENFRMFRQTLRRVRMDMKLAETGAERLVLLDGQLLVAEEDDKVLHQRPMDLIKLTVAQGPREVDTENLGADSRSELAHLDRFKGHGRSLPHVDLDCPENPPPVPPTGVTSGGR